MQVVTITLKTHGPVFPDARNGQTSYIISPVKYGTTLSSVIEHANQYRSRKGQILKLFNPVGQEIPMKLWSMIIRENLIFYVD